MTQGFAPETPVTPTENLATTPADAVIISGTGGVTLSTAGTLTLGTSGAVGAGRLVIDSVAEVVSAAEATAMQGAFSLVMNDIAAAMDAVYVASDDLRERAAATDRFTPTRSVSAILSDTITACDAIVRDVRASIAELASTISAWDGGAARQATLHDTATAFGTAATNLRAFVEQLEEVHAYFEGGGHFDEVVEEVARLTATADGWAQLAAGIDDILTITDLAEGSAVLTALVDERASAGSSTTVTGAFSETLSEAAELYITLNVGGEQFTCVCTNMMNRASSEYRNYNFNSFATVRGKYYGAADDGIYLLEGSTDNGAPIKASLLTGVTDFGSPVLKHVPDGYISRMATGDLKIKLVTVTDGRKQVNTYIAKAATADSYRTVRVPFGKGLRAKYWQMEISNVGGGDFSIDGVEANPVMSMRRI